MRKILLLLACSVIILANAQNNVNVHPQKNKKQSVREMAFKQSPVYKRHQDRAKIAKNSPLNQKAQSGNRSGCFSYTFYDPYTYFEADSSTMISAYAYVWDFGDGNSDTTTYYQNSHYYYQPNYGISAYNVCLTSLDSNGNILSTCCDSIYVGASSYCYADFYFNVDSANEVTFTNYSSSNDSIISYAWDFGDNTGSISQNPIHQYTSNGSYTVCLTITSSSGCSNTNCYNINVNDYSTSCYSYFNYSEAFNTFYFTDLASSSYGNITSWTWDFGDGTYSNFQSPSHMYAYPGYYSVCLTIATDSGCTAAYCDYVNNQVSSDLIVDTIPNLTQTIGGLLFGSCVSVSNLTYTGAPSAIGYFADNSAGIDSAFTSGLLLTTGSIYNAVGPNNSASAGTGNGLPGDSDLDLLVPGSTTFDAAILEFDFTSVSDTVIASKIVFASEEYPEFVNAGVSDAFAFYISGPGINGVKNLALVPNTNSPITIDSLNQNMNSNYFVDNSNGLTYQYDGRSTIIELSQAVIPGQTYHFKIAIADAGDGIFDSGVLIKAGSFNGNTQLPVANFTQSEITPLTVNFNNTSVNANLYGWDFGDGVTDLSANPTHTYAAPGTYTVTLVASNVCYTDTTIMVITVGANSINSLDANNSIKIVPTAADGVFNAIIMSSLNEKADLKIYNVNGQLVVNKSLNSTIGQNNFTLDLTDYAKGLYTVQIVGSKEAFVARMVR
ncbi:MAG: choice-of-anchor L domain-containing protein [Bacteroidota bacterium]